MNPSNLPLENRPTCAARPIAAGRLILAYLRPHGAALATAAGTMLLVTGIHLARPLILREVIDRALPRGDTWLAAWLGLTFIGAVGLGAAALYLRALLLGRVATGVMARLKEDVFARVLRQPMRFFDHLPPGKLINRVENDTEQMRGLVSGAAAQLAANLLLVGAIAALIGWQEPTLGRWIVGTLVLGTALVALYSRFIRGIWREAREHESEVTARLTEFVQGVGLLRLFGKEENAVQHVAEATNARCTVEGRGLFYDCVVFYGTSMFVAEIGSLGGLLWYGTGEVLAGRLTVGTLVMFLELMRRFFGPLRDLAEVFLQLQSGLAASTRVFDLLAQPVEATTATTLPADGGDAGTAAPEPARHPGGARHAAPAAVGAVAEQDRPSRATAVGRFRRLAFERVTFGYGGEPVLHAVSFAVRRGERIGIVGASGSGKSSCIQLLMRFYEPDAGALTLDGRDLRSIDPVTWRRRVALVMQEIHLFPGTVLDNLRAFDPELHERRVMAAARQLGADRFIQRLPNGYHTELAERGANLSLGERQMLCYVRALARNPELLILDEATSAVDAVTERRLQDATERLLAGRTAIIVAHRLSTLIRCDRILVFDRGRLTASGTHRDLVNRIGHYRELARLQGLVHGPVERRRRRRRRAARPAEARRRREVA